MSDPFDALRGTQFDTGRNLDRRGNDLDRVNAKIRVDTVIINELRNNPQFLENFRHRVAEYREHGNASPGQAALDEVRTYLVRDFANVPHVTLPTVTVDGKRMQVSPVTMLNAQGDVLRSLVTTTMAEERRPYLQSNQWYRDQFDHHGRYGDNVYGTVIVPGTNGSAVTPYKHTNLMDSALAAVVARTDAADAARRASAPQPDRSPQR